MLYYRQIGEGPPVVLLHGLFGSLENLGMLARALSERYCVYSVDLPNHGRSPHTAQTSLTLMAQHLADWLSDRSLERASLIGHSLGGKVAMELALAQPAAVERLAVLDIAPVAYAPSHGEVFAGLQAIPLDKVSSRAAADAILASYVEEPAVRGFLLKNLAREDGRYYWRMNLDLLYRDYANLLMANREGVYSGPTLLVKGERSDYLQPDYRAEIQRRFPAAELKIVTGTGHWLHAEKPDLVEGIVSRFLENP